MQFDLIRLSSNNVYCLGMPSPIIVFRPEVYAEFSFVDRREQQKSNRLSETSCSHVAKLN